MPVIRPWSERRRATGAAVVEHYDGRFKLNLSAGEQRDLIEDLKSL
jgi:hypothetical protein